MGIGMIATITVRDGKNAEFEAAFAELAKQVRENEPGNAFYSLNRSMSDPQVYKVLEKYASGEDLDAHVKSAHFAAANAKLADLVAGAPDLEVLEAL